MSTLIKWEITDLKCAYKYLTSPHKGRKEPHEECSNYVYWAENENGTLWEAKRINFENSEHNEVIINQSFAFYFRKQKRKVGHGSVTLVSSYQSCPQKFLDQDPFLLLRSFSANKASGWKVLCFYRLARDTWKSYILISFRGISESFHVARIKDERRDVDPGAKHFILLQQM